MTEEMPNAKETDRYGCERGYERTAPPSQRAAFYSYTQPEPKKFKQACVRPEAAFYSSQLSEFLLMYENVRKAKSPSASLLDFCQSTYEAGATLGNWDRNELERGTGAAMAES
jgi:uncharacterized protein DUF5996